MDPIKSTALALCKPPQQPLVQVRTYMRKMQNLFIERSFKTQITDCRLLHPISIRERILSGRYAHLTIGPGLPKPFNGTRKDLLDIIEKTVHKAVDRMDYNGIHPYLKILDQWEKKGNFRDVRIDSQNEEYGSTCVGMAHAILQDLKDQHNIDGMMAYRRESPAHPLKHSAAIIECSEGFVLLDARSNPKTRIFSVGPFGGNVQYPGFTITASHSGSTTPLTLKCQNGQGFEFCTNVGNGDDLVIKHYAMKAPFESGHEYVPIVTYNDVSRIPISKRPNKFNPIREKSPYRDDGSARKFIGVSLKDSIIFLKDSRAPKGIRAENIPFKFIRDNPEAFRQKLQTFMEPKEPLGPIFDPNESFSGFRIPVEVAYQQLVILASQESRIQRIFIETDPDALF